jgi:uncharacterized protein YodC (DUF2158 family)
MTTTFQIGDTVALKSGGPAMTVENAGSRFTEQPFIDCIWLDESGAFQQKLIDPACLTPVIRKSVVIDGGFYRAIWVFAETGMPIVDHIATVSPMGLQR